MTELENIQKQIGENEKRLAEVMQELRTLKLQLVEKRKEQGAAIAARENAETPGKEIINIQSQINGVDTARLQLLDTLRGLQADKSALLRSMAMDQAENKKSEILQIEVDIYSLLVQAANRLPDLYSSRSDYVAQLVAAGSQDARNEGQKITFLHEKLKRELPNLLDCFPRSVLVDGTLPAPGTVRRTIRRD